MILLVLGRGASFPLALGIIVLRSLDEAATVALSAMVQCLGCLLAFSRSFAVGLVKSLIAAGKPLRSASVGAGRLYGYREVTMGLRTRGWPTSGGAGRVD